MFLYYILAFFSRFTPEDRRDIVQWAKIRPVRVARVVPVLFAGWNRIIKVRALAHQKTAILVHRTVAKNLRALHRDLALPTSLLNG